MTKESTIELQKIDCNCNDCIFLFRLLDKQNDVIKEDRSSQEEIFHLVKEKKIKDISEGIVSLLKHKDIIKDAERKAGKQQNKLTLLQKEKWGYQGQKTPIHYGVCCKFKKEIQFIPNTCQLETQNCFEHRRN